MGLYSPLSICLNIETVFFRVLILCGWSKHKLSYLSVINYFIVYFGACLFFSGNEDDILQVILKSRNSVLNLIQNTMFQGVLVLIFGANQLIRLLN